MPSDYEGLDAVIRVFQADYILFDLVFLFCYSSALYLVGPRDRIALWAWLVGGTIIMAIDWGYWWHITGMREVRLPNSFFPSLDDYWRVTIYMTWFSYTYGVIFAFMYICFDPAARKLRWGAGLLLGWTLVALLSQWFPILPEPITTIRYMARARTIQVAGGLLGYAVLLLLRFRVTRVLQLFAVGTWVHFCMEFALWISGIRPVKGGVPMLLFNSLVESNDGVPVMFLVYYFLLGGKKRIADFEGRKAEKKNKKKKSVQLRMAAEEDQDDQDEPKTKTSPTTESLEDLMNQAEQLANSSLRPIRAVRLGWSALESMLLFGGVVGVALLLVALVSRSRS